MKKKYGLTELILKKRGGFVARLDERAEAAPSCYSANSNFAQYINSVLVVTNHQMIHPSCLVH